MNYSRKFDFLIPFAIFIIGSLSLAILWSLNLDFFASQAIFLAIGFLLFFLFAKIDFKVFESIPWFLYFGSLILLTLTFLFGQISRGATRWLEIGIFTFQPSEIVKPFLILFAAKFFSEIEFQKKKKLLLLAFALLVPIFLILKQPDLGSSLVITSSFLGILIASKVSWRWLLLVLVIAGFCLPLSWHFLADYQKTRITSFLSPGTDSLGAGYNQIQAVITVGSGKIFGRGLGRGTQSHFAFLPEHQTDFIFASLAEELGFVAGLLLLFFYGLIAFRILKIAQKTISGYGRLVCIGIFSMLSFQTFINIGMNMGIAPVTGITLPLVSAGGSSVISWMICLGIVEAVAATEKQEETLEIR